jgi:hypothetical protein
MGLKNLKDPRLGHFINFIIFAGFGIKIIIQRTSVMIGSVYYSDKENRKKNSFKRKN